MISLPTACTQATKVALAAELPQLRAEYMSLVAAQQVVLARTRREHAVAVTALHDKKGWGRVICGLNALTSQNLVRDGA